MPAAAAPHPWRRLLRFSMRGLIVLVLLIGAALGWLVRSARIQREAVAAIETAGGAVGYNWDSGTGRSIISGKPWAPEWLVNLFGVDYFGHVTTVWLSEATDANSALVGRFTRLERLAFDDSSLSDAGWAHLYGLTNLTSLNAAGPASSDDWLVHVKKFPRLSYLDVSSSGVTDRGLVHLKGLSNLSILILSDTRITDGGLAHVSGLTNLSELHLDNDQISDAGVVHLKRLTKLSRIDLTGSPVTAAGVEELSQAMPNLVIIHLVGAPGL